jgi:hypothetical protein
MLPTVLEYEVQPSCNVPAGLPRQVLTVLSPIWRGPVLRLEYPDGEEQLLAGWQGAGEGEPGQVQIFWTRLHPQGPSVCLAIGGDAGLRHLALPRGGEIPPGLPFLALAESLIPPEVLAVIGPAPAPEPVLLA